MRVIVAVDENWGIGKDGDQLVYIKQDLMRFKDMTMGYPIIVGHKTLATFPNGKPLRGRRNIILSHDPELQVEGAEVYHDVASILLDKELGDAYVVGGARVYAALLPYCDTVLVTKIHRIYSADRFFPNLDVNPDWELVDKSETYVEGDVAFHYATYHNRKLS